MSLQTTYNRFIYPEEYEDPFWDNFEQLVSDVDKAIFMNKVKGSLFIGGGGSLAFSSTSGILSWSDNFVIPILTSGFKIDVQFGTDGATRQVGLLDGQALVVEIPFAMSANVTRNFSVVSQLQQTSHTQWVAAVRIGDKVYFRGLGEVG